MPRGSSPRSPKDPCANSCPTMPEASIRHGDAGGTSRSSGIGPSWWATTPMPSSRSGNFFRRALIDFSRAAATCKGSELPCPSVHGWVSGCVVLDNRGRAAIPSLTLDDAHNECWRGDVAGWQVACDRGRSLRLPGWGKALWGTVSLRWPLCFQEAPLSAFRTPPSETVWQKVGRRRQARVLGSTGRAGNCAIPRHPLGGELLSYRIWSGRALGAG